MEVVDIKLGPEGDVKLVLEAGVIKLTLDEKTPGLSGAVTVNIPLNYFLDALVVKANSPIVTGVVKVIEGVLVAIP